MLNLRKKGSGLLLAFLLNTIIANLVETASKVEEMLEDIERHCSTSKRPGKHGFDDPATPA